jgi:uncharacterized C2H2 Zn-finger protein
MREEAEENELVEGRGRLSLHSRGVRPGFAISESCGDGESLQPCPRCQARPRKASRMFRPTAPWVKARQVVKEVQQAGGLME